MIFQRRVKAHPQEVIDHLSAVVANTDLADPTTDQMVAAGQHVRADLGRVHRSTLEALALSLIVDRGLAMSKRAKEAVPEMLSDLERFLAEREAPESAEDVPEAPETENVAESAAQAAPGRDGENPWAEDRR